MDIKRYGFKTEDYSVYMSEFKNGKYYKVSEAKGIIEDNKLMIDTLEVQEAEIKKLREALDYPEDIPLIIVEAIREEREACLLEVANIYDKYSKHHVAKKCYEAIRARGSNE